MDIQGHSIPIDIKRINQILGTDLGDDEYLRCLKDLGFEI